MDEFNLAEGDILTQITKYELHREDGRIFIDIHKPLAGANKEVFFAVPNLLLQSGKGEYIGKGKTEEDALKDCLSKIKGVSIDKIIQKGNSD